MATHSSILAWRIPWTEEPGGLQGMGSQKSQTRLGDKTTTRIGLNAARVSEILLALLCLVLPVLPYWSGLL